MERGVRCEFYVFAAGWDAGMVVVSDSFLLFSLSYVIESIEESQMEG